MIGCAFVLFGRLLRSAGELMWIVSVGGMTTANHLYRVAIGWGIDVDCKDWGIDVDCKDSKYNNTPSFH